MRAREYRFPRIERTDTCSSGRHFRWVTTRAPWQLISIVGAISEAGLSGLLSFTNIFSATRCSFRPVGCVPATATPLGRAVHTQMLPQGQFDAMVLKGNHRPPTLYPGLAPLLALPGEPITIRLPVSFAQTVHLGGIYV